MSQGRVPADTDAEPWAIRGGPRRGFAITLLVALALHLPVMPTSLGTWMRYFFRPPPAPEGPQQPLVIPVELLTDEPAEVPELEPEDEGASGQGDDDPFGADEGEGEGFDLPDEEGDGFDLPDEEGDDFELPDEDDGDFDLPDDEDEGDRDVSDPPQAPAPLSPQANPPPAPPPAPKAPAPKAPSPLPEGSLVDPFRAAGGAAEVRAAEPNVNIYLANDIVRRSELAPRFTELLHSIPQWQQLLGGTGLDPIRDFDHILISGPQMRDPSWIVISIHFNGPAFRVKKALDAMIAKGGKGAGWEKGYSLPVARFGRRISRLAVLHPRQRLLVVLPGDTDRAQVEKVAQMKGFSKASPAAIILDLVDPANAFREAPFAFPATIRRMRLHLALQGQDFLVTTEAWDASPEAATKNAAFLEQQLTKLTEPPLPMMPRLLGKPSFRTEGSKIIATAPASYRQVKTILGLVRTALEVREKERQEEAAKKRREALAERKKAMQRRRRGMQKARGLEPNPRLRPEPSSSAAPAPSSPPPPPPTTSASAAPPAPSAPAP